MHSIFISYRRTDAGGYAGRLDERLAAAFGREHVFIDIDSISYGDDFLETIHRTLQDCDVVLVLIGPHWLTATDSSGARRLDSPSDTIVLEITTAFEMQRRVLPVLIGDATMPAPEALPASIRKLARHNAIEISDRRFNKDAQELIETLRKLLAASPRTQAPTPPQPAGGASAAPAGSTTTHPPPRAPSSLPPDSGKATEPASWFGGWRKRMALLAVVAVPAVYGVLSSRPWGQTTPPLNEPTAVVTEAHPDMGASEAAARLASNPPSATGSDAAPSAYDAAARAARGAAEAAASAAMTPSPQSTARPQQANFPQIAAGNPWLSSALYGSDGPGVALKKVTLRPYDQGYRINVSNEFNFECSLDFDGSGNPARLSGCASKDPPSPQCGQDDPHSSCAQNSGCFHVTIQARPDCFTVWSVKEPEVRLACSSRKSEQVCKGKYTLVASSGLSDPVEFTIARRLP